MDETYREYPTDDTDSCITCGKTLTRWVCQVGNGPAYDQWYAEGESLGRFDSCDHEIL